MSGDDFEIASKIRAMKAFRLWEKEMKNVPVIGRNISTASKQCKVTTVPFEVKTSSPTDACFESNKMAKSPSETHWTANVII